MEFPVDQKLLDFIREQQRKLTFLQRFKTSLDTNPCHYQAFIAALSNPESPANVVAFGSFVKFVVENQFHSPELIGKAIQDTLPQYISFPDIESMVAHVQQRLRDTRAVVPRPQPLVPPQQRKVPPVSRKRSNPSQMQATLERCSTLTNSQLMGPPTTGNLHDILFKRPYPGPVVNFPSEIGSSFQMSVSHSLFHPMMHPLVTGQQLPPSFFLQPGASQNQTVPNINNEDNSDK